MNEGLVIIQKLDNMNWDQILGPEEMVIGQKREKRNVR